MSKPKRDAKTLRLVSRDLRLEARALRVLQLRIGGETSRFEARARELANWADHYLHQAQALEKK